MPKASQHARAAGRLFHEPLFFSLKIGFFAGLIWGSLRWLAVAMNFTDVPQAFLADPWVQRSKLIYPYWQITGFFLFILMSMAAGLSYWLIFRKFRGPLPGIVFGIGWWLLFYLAIGPLIGAVPPLDRIGWKSIIADFCLFCCWGAFIGYSITFEFHDESAREPEPAGA